MNTVAYESLVTTTYEEAVKEWGRDGPVSPLLPCLHGMRDELGCIPENVIPVIARTLGLTNGHVLGVCNAYDAFRDREPILQIGIPTCIGNLTHGAQELMELFCTTLGTKPGVVTRCNEGLICVECVSCHGRCTEAPYIVVGEHVYTHVTETEVRKIALAIKSGAYAFWEPEEKILPLPAMSDFAALKTAIAIGGDAVIQKIIDSKLDGRGGALFAAGTKWKGLKTAKIRSPKYIVVNCDEGEPGTNKDGAIIRAEIEDFTVWDLIEGILVAGFATEATNGYIYIRHEYPREKELLDRAIDMARDAGFLGDDILGTGWNFTLQTFQGAGGYVRGEVTALLNSMEGGQGIPRKKLGRTTERGLDDKPTLVNNVETLSWVPRILLKGPEWFVKEGCSRIYTISGDVREPCCVIASQETTLGELIEQAGGMEGEFLAAFPGGFSTVPITGRRLKMNWKTLDAAGSSPGSGAVMVLNTTRLPKLWRYAYFVADFFHRESCKQCTLCGEGTHRLVTWLAEGPLATAHMAHLRSLAMVPKGMTMCGLGQGAFQPIARLCTFALSSQGERNGHRH